jgi:acyl transferase domain-containing protein/thioesterase domain-containing protein/acyl carrier protein
LPSNLRPRLSLVPQPIIVMSDLASRVAGLSPAQRQLLEQRLKSRLPAAKPLAEPIAIVGMACRFPGAPNLDAYWRLIDEGRSAVGEVPADRWNADDFYDPNGETPGKMSVRWAAFIERPDQFDPQFFGITPREAVRMDPQQRLLLEVAWEAMENAGRPADELAGSRTGVFIGIGGTDYSKVGVPYDDYYQQIDAHLGTGNALSIAANRLSYVFDFHGPSAAVDTACSSSSLAIHLAVESLRRGESDAALAGGANLILTPETTIAFSKARMLSPEGVCRPFDARANGYVRGEGCGLVLLKRLADAQRDGDNILAVLRATSVNQDGRTSGISAPNSQSQLACIREALKQAALSPDDIDYIEAHGTGTPLGDPIEMMALSQIFRTNVGESLRDSQTAVSERLPDERPCYVASVKANVGHMETVSGVAGLIKVVLMMQHEQIAPQTHFESLNPHIKKIADTRLVIPTEHVPWSAREQSRRAGVSSFGFGGTNTHLVVESTNPKSEIRNPKSNDRPTHLLKLSAKSEAALKSQAEQLATYLEQNADASLADVCWSTNTGRADFNHRAVIVANDTGELRKRLTLIVGGEAASAAGIKQGSVRSIGRPGVAFLFTGQGAQYVGMGRALYESQPVFRRALDNCETILRECWGGESLLDILYPQPRSNAPESSLDQTRYTQPALFALEYALAELWKSWGVTPDIVLGHSVGEYAAACVAGIMSLEDGLRLIAERARLMQNVQRSGKMAVVFASPDRVAKELEGTAGDVVIAVINGPENTVISGDAAAVESLAEKFAADGVQVKMLNVSHAFHSPLMDEMLDEFEKFAETIQYHPPRVPLAANLTGRLMTEAPTARYWRDHLRNTVQFAAGMTRVAEAHPAVIIEIGPTASLLGMGRRCEPDLAAAWLPSLRQGQDDWQTIAGSVAEYYVRGGRIDWRGWDHPWQRRRLLLPNYPFQRSRHWFTFDESRRRGFAGEPASHGASRSAAHRAHPLLGAPLTTIWTNKLFEARVSMRSPAYLADHQVQGSVVTPAAAYIEQGLAAAADAFGPGRHGLSNLAIQQAMFLPEGTTRRVQVSIAPESGGESAFETYSRPEDEHGSSAPWTMHARGSLVHESKVGAIHRPAQSGLPGDELERIDLEAARGRAVTILERDEFYKSMAERGLVYGPAFQVLSELHHGVEDAVAQITLPESVRREAAAYHLHPALGDALLQMMSGAVPLEDDGSFSPFTYMPVAIQRVCVVTPIEDYNQPLSTYVVRTSKESGPSPERVEADIYLAKPNGEILLAFEGVQVQRLGRTSASDSVTDTSRWLYQIEWHEQPLSGKVAPSEAVKHQRQPGTWIIFADSKGLGRALADRLTERGEASLLVEPGQQLELLDSESENGDARHPANARLNPLDEQHYQQLLDAAFHSRNQPCRGVVHLWSLDIPSESTVSDELQGFESSNSSETLGCGSVLQLIRALSRAEFSKQPHMWLITAGAQSVTSDSLPPSPISHEQSPLVGFARVAAMELPDLRPRLVDLDPIDLAPQLAKAAVALADEIQCESGEGEVAYRGDRRFVARLERNASLLAESSRRDIEALEIPRGPFQLRIAQAGSLDALRFAAVDRDPPAPGQVEIEVRATGLNFSDVLKALGLYPGIKDAIVPLGIEASGVVTAVGEGVERFKVGDEVLGVVPYAFASHARTADYALVHKPQSLSHEEACTIPITFLTAYYGLVRLAQLQPGERVLIHAGAGGVGLAAIQIAQQIGADVFATAGSEAKRDFLRSLGVKHVYSSRSTAFADEILAATNREGVDVVLNSLPGEAITKSLSILRAYGRFLEIGKTDIYQNRMIGLLPFQDNLSYFAIDLDRMLRQRPDYIRELFADVMRYFDADHYQPLAFTRFDAEKTIDAFRYMSQRKNIGKVVVTIESRESRVEGRAPESSDDSSKMVRADGTYLITGGLGALGLRIAQWLAEQGAGTIALLSRRQPSAEIEEQLNAIRTKGANVLVVTGDVADVASLASALSQITADCPPLRGVIHAAGVLADGILTDMTLDQLDRAMAPKVRGAWNLHVATLDAPLDFLVLFSSVASVLGSPGQANYAAGNAYLDALAHARRAQGRPATAINWGPWAGSGMAAEAGRSEGMKSRGMGLIEPETGLDLLGKLLRTDAAQVAVMDAQWSEMLRLLGSRRPALLSQIAEEVQGASDEPQGRVDHAFRRQLIEADDATRRSLVQDYIRQELARIMGIEPARLEIDQPLSTFGLDSLLALELKNNLEGRLDFTLPMAKLMEGPSIASLADETARLVAAGESGVSDTQSAADATDAWSPLLALRPTGSHPPLVLLPALGGDVRCYSDLVERLGDEYPAYAFRPRGIEQNLPPHVRMDEMVTDYAAALRELQPAGPYYLAGWSAGGIFAFALAEQLVQSGEEVALVAMFDTPLPSVCADIDVEDDARFLCELVTFANHFSGTDVRIDYNELTRLAPEDRFSAALAEARRCGLAPAGTPEEFIRRLVHVGEANIRAIQSYEPHALPIPVRLFVPETRSTLTELSGGRAAPTDKDLGWSSQVGQNVELHKVSGDHFSMMLKDGAEDLARVLSAMIDETRVASLAGQAAKPQAAV